MFTEKEIKDHFILVRATKKQKDVAQGLAQKKGITLSELILRLLEEELKNGGVINE